MMCTPQSLYNTVRYSTFYVIMRFNDTCIRTCVCDKLDPTYSILGRNHLCFRLPYGLTAEVFRSGCVFSLYFMLWFY